MPTLPFRVDSKLLRELGGRLVGKPFIALAELIKNSYDADATIVEIEFEPTEDGAISVRDNGCGMSFEEFRDYWMRIGSTHKEEWKYSREFRRLLTGQKGVGRLAVQLLAREMKLTTVSKTKSRLKAFVRWEDAIESGDLTEATVEYEVEKGDFDKGTTIELMGLNQNWGDKEVKNLARELWKLEPPFRGFKSEKSQFEIDFKSGDKRIEKRFRNQLKAVLKAHESKISGRNRNGEVKASITRRDGEQIDFAYNLNELPGVNLLPDKQLIGGEFEIRIYSLIGHQSYGIKVDDLREYMHEYSGVHIYDTGFHLPYYGGKESDWLGVLSEHARRLSMSDLLPDGLQVAEGLTRLPNLDRLLGVVVINTGQEPGLEIAITRDRLLDTETYRALRAMVRYALHFFAMEDKKRIQRSAQFSREIIRRPEELERVEEVLEKYKKGIPETVFGDLKEEIEGTIKAADEREKRIREQVSLLGAFATAGISSLAYHHEIRRQIATIGEIAKDIGKLAERNDELFGELTQIKDEMLTWSQRAKNLQSLFDYYADTDNLSVRQRLPAEEVIGDIWKQVHRLDEDVKFVPNVSKDLLLPEAALVEWGAIFQNVLVNAFNAMADSEIKRIEIVSRHHDSENEILVMDTGSGIDMDDADELFMPFVRRIEIPPEKRALGYGGSGIGLTIVKMISERIGCAVSFVEPPEGYNTAFSLSWREEE